MGRRPEKSEISPVRQGAPTVSVPYLIRPKLDSNTVSLIADLGMGTWLRTREVMSCPLGASQRDWWIL